MQRWYIDQPTGEIHKDSAMSKHIIFLAAFGLLGACTSSALNNATNTRFEDPNTNGTFNVDFSTTQSTRKQYKDDDNDGYAFMGGVIEGDGLHAVAGILPQTTVDAPVSAKVDYTGRYNMLSIESISISGGYVSGTPDTRTGELTGTADFGAKTFNAKSGNGLSLTGTISGTNVTGTMDYKDTVSGQFKALAGEDKAIGVFHGKSDSGDQMVAGGFNMTKN